MSQIIQRLDQQQLKSLCGVVAHTSEGLTKSELTTLLGQCGICAVDDGSSRNQLGYTISLQIHGCSIIRTTKKTVAITNGTIALRCLMIALLSLAGVQSCRLFRISE